MSTRCLIGKENNDGIKYIYCHNDGYPSGVGETLKEFYTDENKIDQLISLGDLSSLDENLEVKDRQSLNKTFKIDNYEIICSESSEEGMFLDITRNSYDDKHNLLNTETKKYNLFDVMPSAILTIVDYCNLITMKDVSKFLEEIDEYKEKLKQVAFNTTIAYHRDRGEKLNISITSDEKDLIQCAESCWAEYAYLWKDGEWLMCKIINNDNKEFKKF